MNDSNALRYPLENCVDVFRNAEEGERITMSFVAKTDDIYRGEWHKATASKKEDHFEVIFDENPSIILQYYNSDEQKSLVSENLWAIGWYMLPDQADALSRQKDNGQGSVAVEDINHINRNNFEGKYFEGELRSGMKCKFFESVTCTRGKTVFTFNTVDSVLHKSEISFLLLSFMMHLRPKQLCSSKNVIFRILCHFCSWSSRICLRMQK